MLLGRLSPSLKIWRATLEIARTHFAARTVLFEPRGAWRTLSDSGFFGGNTFVSALRADPISASDSDFQFWRATLEIARMHFAADGGGGEHPR